MSVSDQCLSDYGMNKFSRFTLSGKYSDKIIIFVFFSYQSFIYFIYEPKFPDRLIKASSDSGAWAKRNR